jgi:hypothetical protein
VKNVSNRHSAWVIEGQGGGWEINTVSREVGFDEPLENDEAV